MSLHNEFPVQTARTLRAINESLRTAIEANGRAIDAIERGDDEGFKRASGEVSALLARAGSILDTLRP